MDRDKKGKQHLQNILENFGHEKKQKNKLYPLRGFLWFVLFCCFKMRYYSMFICG